MKWCMRKRTQRKVSPLKALIMCLDGKILGPTSLSKHYGNR